jgi:thiol:disulfide interchange protein DsbD
MIAAMTMGGLASAAAAVDPFAPRHTAIPLTADEAFRPLPPLLKGDQLKLEWDITPGYYLYRSRIEVSVVSPATIHLGALSLPKGQPHHDDHLGDDEIYRNDLTATATGATGLRRVRLRYQGCADAGLCYPPAEKEFDVAAEAGP